MARMLGESKRKRAVWIFWWSLKKPLGFLNLWIWKNILKIYLKIKVNLASQKTLKPHIGEHILRETLEGSAY